MSIVTLGKVTNGVVVPNIPLPEGAWAEIHVHGPALEIPPDLQEELAAWQQASAEALVLVERLADEETVNEKG